jgi:hypothetical protein
MEESEVTAGVLVSVDSIEAVVASLLVVVGVIAIVVATAELEEVVGKEIGIVRVAVVVVSAIAAV